MSKKKKETSLAGLGAKYGLKPRKKYTSIYRNFKRKRKCPECGSTRFHREAVGIWACKKCEFKTAGLAYDIKIRS